MIKFVCFYSHSSSFGMTHLIFCRPMDPARPLFLIAPKHTVKAGPISTAAGVSLVFSLHPLPIKLVFWLSCSGKAPPPIWLQYGQNKRYHLKQKCPKCVWGDLAHGQRFSACMRVCVCVCVCRWLCWGQGYQSGMLLQSATLGQKLRVPPLPSRNAPHSCSVAWSFNHWQ